MASEARTFKKQWRDHRWAATRPADLVTRPRWTDSGLIVLATLLVAGVLLGATVTVDRAAALPAMAQETAVTAIRTGSRAPDLVVSRRSSSAREAC